MVLLLRGGGYSYDSNIIDLSDLIQIIAHNVRDSKTCHNLSCCIKSSSKAARDDHTGLPRSSVGASKFLSL